MRLCRLSLLGAQAYSDDLAIICARFALILRMSLGL